MMIYTKIYVDKNKFLLTFSFSLLKKTKIYKRQKSSINTNFTTNHREFLHLIYGLNFFRLQLLLMYLVIEIYIHSNKETIKSNVKHLCKPFFKIVWNPSHVRKVSLVKFEAKCTKIY